MRRAILRTTITIRLEAILDLIPAGLDKLKGELVSRQNELSLYENESDKLRVSNKRIGEYKDQSDLLLNFAHIGRWEKTSGEKRKTVCDKSKRDKIKLREEMECKFEDLKQRMKGASLLQAASTERRIESISQTIS